ncbi:MAG: SagB/ThcOx family dehydrogenase [Pseudonocardiaceae bacterium]|nr:SagB/ThcOx family dehydrogenase [Pseudonocardiaceae bacterium]
MSVIKYALSPLATISRTGPEGQIVIHGGSGFDRQRVEIGGQDGGASALVTWILAQAAPATHDELIESLSDVLDLSSGDASEVVTQLTEAHVLVDAVHADEVDYGLRRWAAHGWDEAALFHYSTFGQPFDPDTLGDVSYEDYYRSILDDLSTAGPQPPASKRAASSRSEFPHDEAPGPSIPFVEVLDRAAPINRFGDQGIELSELQSVLSESFQAQRTIGGGLGKHLIKAYPSGGARHPLEMYVIAKSITGLPASAYHFDAVDGTLRPLTNNEAVMGVDAACFGKGGIVTASAVLVITSRWLRHNWKYRYSRSYRMVLLELGHAIQAIHLSARASGLAVYHCPSINDAELLPLLELTDDCAEGPSMHSA